MGVYGITSDDIYTVRNKYFALCIIAIVFDNLDLIIPICSFQLSLSSIKIPKT